MQDSEQVRALKQINNTILLISVSLIVVIIFFLLVFLIWSLVPHFSPS
jgi:uncharacterized membrane protein YidH (DUF202 family)